MIGWELRMTLWDCHVGDSRCERFDEVENGRSSQFYSVVLGSSCSLSLLVVTRMERDMYLFRTRVVRYSRKPFWALFHVRCNETVFKIQLTVLG
jgi:hypothetical protein